MSEVINLEDLAGFTERQRLAVSLLTASGDWENKPKFFLYGGAMGGGKSYLLRWYALLRLVQLAAWGLRRPVAMLACEDYPSLKDRQISRFSLEVPPSLGQMHTDHPEYGRCFILHPRYGGGVLCFRNLDDASKYASAEFALICVDELTRNSYEVFTFLRTRLRWPGLKDIEAQFVAASNPGGPGHGWVKQFWIDRLFPPEWRDPVDYSRHFMYLPARAVDNPHLDASYWHALGTLPEHLRAAYRDGSWDLFIGQAFPELKREVHGIEPMPVPDGAQLYMTLDWGFGKPFSVGWWWVDGDGRVYRFYSWYGAHGPDEGLRLTDSQIAEGILLREEMLGISGRPIMRYAGFDCFNKKPDYKGGGQGPTTAETFLGYGLTLIPADSKRSIKIRQFREYLRVREDGRPMMYIYRNTGDNEEFFRTIQSLTVDKINPEDVDTRGEDHIYDEACHICMARPLRLEAPQPERGFAEKIVAAVENRLDKEEIFCPYWLKGENEVEEWWSDYEV